MWITAPCAFQKKKLFKPFRSLFSLLNHLVADLKDEGFTLKDEGFTPFQTVKDEGFTLKDENNFILGFNSDRILPLMRGF
jgi:hypothetical protein